MVITGIDIPLRALFRFTLKLAIAVAPAIFLVWITMFVLLIAGSGLLKLIESTFHR